MSTEPEPGLVPEHLRIRYRDDQPPIVLTIDGQEFRVRERAGKPGTYDFDWLNGPHEYGFAISGGSAMTRPEMEEHVRTFLAMIDPTTGYIEE
ncbi:hypothetical protein AB0873_13315 [Micromonospora sp. NPDC047707]|uniref:hypothetical protein n=1 Tax=Micromonospora sp. NPDC047707 TaxID=3154498 RepID=UPI0034570780